MKTTINDRTIAYEERGQGPPMMLVHGFPTCAEVWQQQGAGLSSHYRVIMPDLRGFGGSDGLPGPTTMETFADDLAGLLDVLALDRVVLGGLSMGGYIALAFVRRHAARLCGLVLCDTRATPDTEEARANREVNAQLVEAKGASAIADKMIPNLLSASAPPQRQAYLRSLIERNHPVGIASALRGMGLRSDSTDILPTISVPTLIVVGEDDILSPPAEMWTLQQAIPGSRLVEIAGAGHISNLDQPEAFNTTLEAFLHDVYGSGS